MREIYYEGINSSRIFPINIYLGRLKFFNNTIIYECDLGENIHERYIERDDFRQFEIFSIRHGKGYRIIINITYKKIRFGNYLELGKGRYRLLIKNREEIFVEVL